MMLIDGYILVLCDLGPFAQLLLGATDCRLKAVAELTPKTGEPPSEFALSLKRSFVAVDCLIYQPTTKCDVQ